MGKEECMRGRNVFNVLMRINESRLEARQDFKLFTHIRYYLKISFIVYPLQEAKNWH